MKLIEKISIKYFRSLHTVDVKKCSDVNVISGRNDVGKSNLIKALNLFFNGQSDWESEFNFYDNFSKKRLDTVRQKSVKGRQFISVKIEFIRPKNYKGSLPEKFSVERKWYRESKTFEQSNNLVTLQNNDKLPSTLTSAQRSLATFLNKVHFEYVPAIRDRAYVNELLGRLQSSLLEVNETQNKDLLQTAETLAEHIEGQIGDLQEDFETATNIKTAIEPPSTISSLFQSFLVSTDTQDGAVLLKCRGDGLQSRYVASVLNYIAANSRDFFIWGYEEPEIALEYSHVSALAQDFSEKYSKCAQIFLSSHSPAFISLEGDGVSCYRVSQDNAETEIANVGLAGDLDGKNKLKEELGILEIQKEVHQQYSKKLEDLLALNQRVKDLEIEAAELSRPLVITEGKTDKSILEIAYSKINGSSSDLAFRSCDNSGGDGNVGGAGQLAKVIDTIHPEDGRLAIAVFDNDKEGQDAFEKLSKNFHLVDWNNDLKKHKNGLAWAIKIPEPSFRSGFVDAKNLCVEYLFRDEVLAKPFSNGQSIEIKEPDCVVIVGGVQQHNPQNSITTLPCQKKIGNGKSEFAEQVVPTLIQSDFIGFESLFQSIARIITPS